VKGRRIPLLAALGATVLAIAIPILDASEASASGQHGACSRSTAKALIDAHPHLDPWVPLSDRPGEVLCGPFLGKGSRAMVVSFAASICGGDSGWAVFRRHAGRWNLVWRYRNGQASIAKVGDEISETLNILKPTDPRCVPTGGTKTRLRRWNGTQFVAGKWNYHYLNPESFLSPDRKVWCSVFATTGASCGTYPEPPTRAAFLGDDGRVSLCEVLTLEYPNGSRVPNGCFQNWPAPGDGTPVLSVGESSEVGGIRCTVASDGVTCVKISGAGKGHGFRVNASEVSELGS
jgi:hypothetical protein